MTARIGIPFEVLVKLARTDRTVASVMSMWQNGAIVSLESALILMVETLSKQNQYLMNAYSRQMPVDQNSPDMQTAIERFEAYWRHEQEQENRRRATDVATRVRLEEKRSRLRLPIQWYHCGCTASPSGGYCERCKMQMEPVNEPPKSSVSETQSSQSAASG